MKRFLLPLLIAWAASLQAQAPAVFHSYRAEQDPALSADPESPFWKDVRGVHFDKNILNEPDPSVATDVRSRWTDRYVYFLFYGPYQVLNLKPDPDTQKETYKLWQWDCYEVYLGANFEKTNLYGEFQMSPQSEFLDLGIDSTRPRPGWNDERLWDSGMEVKGRIDAGKKIWYGEMRIPIASIDKRTPKTGNEFRINLYRQQAAGEGKRFHFLAWQPTGEWNPHHPEKFGTLRFEDRP